MEGYCRLYYKHLRGTQGKGRHRKKSQRYLSAGGFNPSFRNGAVICRIVMKVRSNSCNALY